MNKLNGIILGLALVVATGVYAAEQEPKSPRTQKFSGMLLFLDTERLDAKHVTMLRDVVRAVNTQFESLEKEQEAKQAKAQEEIERIRAIHALAKKDLES